MTAGTAFTAESFDAVMAESRTIIPTGDADAARRFAETLPQHLRTCRPALVLERSISSGRIAHATLLYGEDLRELETVSEVFAGAMLGCESDKVSQNPDFIALRPSGKMRQIRIGERGEGEDNTMRTFLRQISQTPNAGSRKIAVVYEADRMNTATANAFLKTLEEPPADTLLLLLSTRPYELLDTIRSRCFHFKIDADEKSGVDGRWAKWLESYGEWLKRVSNKPRKPDEVASAIIALYALSQRFSETLESMSDESWAKEKETLPPDLPEDQLTALEAGSRKGLRQFLFAQIEDATLSFAKEDETGAGFQRIFKVRDELERSARLCEVFNLREDAALESFFLSSMRSWAGG
jgi:DNA polymerase III subunit delta'